MLRIPYFKQRAIQTVDATQQKSRVALSYKWKNTTSITLPIFLFTTTWLGASYCVKRFEYTNDNQLSLPQINIPNTDSLNYVAVLAWEQDGAIVRQKLWHNDKLIAYFDEYDNAILASRFFIEIWTLEDEVTATNATAFNIQTSLYTLPETCSDVSDSTLVLPYTEVWDNLMDLTGIVWSGVDGDYWTFDSIYYGIFVDMPTVVPDSIFEDDFESYNDEDVVAFTNSGTGWGDVWVPAAGESAGTVYVDGADKFFEAIQGVRELANNTWTKCLIGIRLGYYHTIIADDINLIFGLGELGLPPYYPAGVGKFIGIWQGHQGYSALNVLAIHAAGWKLDNVETGYTLASGSNTQFHVPFTGPPGQVMFFEFDKAANKLRLAVCAVTDGVAPISEAEMEAVVESGTISTALNYIDYSLQEWNIDATRQTWYPDLTHFHICTGGSTLLAKTYRIYGKLL